MTDPTALVTVAVSTVAGITILSLTALRGWNGWLDMQRHHHQQTAYPRDPAASPTTRIELADLKERVRKLEAIAAGVDL